MAKQKEKQNKDEVNETIKLNSHISDVNGKSIVIKSIDSNFKTVDVHYFIRIDGSIEQGDAVDDSIIIIGMLEGSQVNWTMIQTLVASIKELKNQGAGSVKRYDEYYPGLINPQFNLTHALTKFSIR